jgi:hypothetical protein
MLLGPKAQFLKSTLLPGTTAIDKRLIHIRAGSLEEILSGKGQRKARSEAIQFLS